MLANVWGLLHADLAVDLGTANTLVAAPGAGLLLNEPSVVAVSEGSRRIVSGGCAVGHVARQMLGRTPESISVVRPLACGVVADLHLCEAMLRYFLRKARLHRFSRRPRLLVAIPACITQVERRAVVNSALRAGARQVLLMRQSLAAALGVGLPVAEPVGSMIVDIGSGTTEVAVLSLGDIVAEQSIRVGGDQFDQAIVQYLRRHYSLQIGAATAERIRIDIGCAYPLEQQLHDEVAGLDTVGRLPRRITLTSDEVRQALGDPLEQIVDAVRSTLDRCNADLASDLVDQGFVLTGGGALLRGLDRYLGERTGLNARLAQDPLTAVARGASICLENLGHWHALLESSDHGM